MDGLIFWKIPGPVPPAVESARRKARPAATFALAAGVLLGLAVLSQAVAAQVPPAAAQNNPALSGAKSGGDVAQWEIEAIEKKIRLTLDFERNALDIVLFEPDIYQIKIVNSFPKPAYREQEAILQTYLADYVTDLNRDGSFIQGRKTAKSAAPEYLVELAKHAPPVTVVPLADRKITKIIKIQKKKYGDNRTAEFLYDFVPHVPGLALKRELKGMIEYGSDSREQILVIHGVLFEDQGVLEFKKNQ